MLTGSLSGGRALAATLVPQHSPQFAGVADWYRERYHSVMAMTLRLDKQETDALRQRAAREGRSMQDVARQAVRDYIDRTSKRELLDDVLGEEIPRYAEALRRLAE